MEYRKGYKYQLATDECFETSFRSDIDIHTPRIILLGTGQLIVREGYAWDGASGPVIDRKTNMVASCGHDALYQLMRMGMLDSKMYSIADLDFGCWLEEAGAWSLVIKMDLLGLRIARGYAALPKNRKKVFEV